MTKLEEIHEGLIHQEYSDNLVGLREQLKQNQHVRKWIIKAPIETLQEEGQKLLGWINVNKISQNGETVNQDWVASSTRIKHVLESLHGKREKLKESWHARKRRLEKCVQYHLFLLDSEKVSKSVHACREFGRVWESLKVLYRNIKLCKLLPTTLAIHINFQILPNFLKTGAAIFYFML